MSFEIATRTRPETPAPAPPVADLCCDDGACHAALENASTGFRNAVLVVAGLNGAMFLLEVVAGQMAGSMSLQADALDFAGDTATYGLTLYALTKSATFRANAALVKGISLAVMAAYVIGGSLWRTFVVGAPDAVTMGWVGALALAVNLFCALLLIRFRDGDANTRSVWLCSRNDAIGNLAVLAAAGATAWTATRWADLAVAVIMAGLFSTTAWQVIRQARGELDTRAGA